MTDYLGLGLASLGTSVIYFGLAIKIPKPHCRKLDKVHLLQDFLIALSWLLLDSKEINVSLSSDSRTLLIDTSCCTISFLSSQRASNKFAEPVLTAVRGLGCPEESCGRNFAMHARQKIAARPSRPGLCLCS